MFNSWGIYVASYPTPPENVESLGTNLVITCTFLRENTYVHVPYMSLLDLYLFLLALSADLNCHIVYVSSRYKEKQLKSADKANANTLWAIIALTLTSTETFVFAAPPDNSAFHSMIDCPRAFWRCRNPSDR